MISNLCSFHGRPAVVYVYRDWGNICMLTTDVARSVKITHSQVFVGMNCGILVNIYRKYFDNS